MRKILILSAILLSAPVYAHKVIGVSDGDTMTLLVDRKPVKIRLANVDAPEKKQAFGQRSKQSLSDICFGKDATYKTQAIDRYGRTVAVVTCAGVEANRAQVEKGMAWVYVHYNKDKSLPAVQNAAKASRKGLWADASPVPPWQFRHPSKAIASDCLVGPRGGRYQIVNWQKRYGC
jgi:micrococcal nuclease